MQPIVMTREQLYGALFGVAVGDALGVPAEFKSRSYMEQNPVTDMEGYKSHNQPPGTFSDDSSLTFCLAASLCNGYDLQDMADRFVRWRDHAYWAAGGDVFDIGYTTDIAISRLRKGVQPDLAGDMHEGANGNGSLMRILPLLFYNRNLPIDQRYETTKAVSSLTHGHIRSVIACFYYLEYALCLLQGKDRKTAYTETAQTVGVFIKARGIVQQEIDLFAPLLQEDISTYALSSLSGSGYVMNTLKASMHCFLTTDNYRDAVLRAIHLGEDTDTTAAVTGGLAGLYYGYQQIPEPWRKGIRRSSDIIDLCEHLFIALAP